MITIIAIGKKHESWVEVGVQRYESRLLKPFNVSWLLLPHSSREGVDARDQESVRIAERLQPSDYVILLDEVGSNISSPALSKLLIEQFVHTKRVVCVIGGAYGVSAALQERANFTWSLSKLVFPHQLVRLLISEQIYRAQQIESGGSYHHD